MSGFELSKWYMDCVSDAGDVVIAYVAEVRWGRVRLHYASVLLRPAGQTPEVAWAVHAVPRPEMGGATLSWAYPALRFEGRWTGLAPAAEAILFDSGEGRVEWRCLQPRSLCAIEVRGRTLRGLGYAEHLRLTIAPWRMPIEELRWGRFVGRRRALVWVDWRGPHARRLVLLDGESLDGCRVDEGGVASGGDDVRLSLAGGEVLRSGKIGETALSRVPGLRRLPPRILALEETKWCSRGTLEGADGQRDEGWVIHELVRWPRRDGTGRGVAWVGQLLYGLLFAAVLPLLLVLWARATERTVHAPAVRAPWVGLSLAVLGAACTVAGWVALWRQGGGLPMNAYPPPRYVAGGAYRWIAHPIYVGFALACVGMSIASGSASGLWLVSPAVVLASVALVLGYERADLEARFPGARLSPWLGVPRGGDERPPLPERLAAAVVGLGPWLVPLVASGARPRAVDAVIVLLALAAPFVVPTRSHLRTLVVRSLLALPWVLGLPLLSSSIAPSKSVVLALLAADAWSCRARRVGAGWLRLAFAIAALDLGLGCASATGVLAGVAVFAVVVNSAKLWDGLRDLAERVANSWQEWRVGPVRILGHGAWAALGTCGGVVIIGTLIGSRHLGMVVLAALASLVASALWAQWVEGSPALLRPYGFYGGLFGICLTALLGPLFGTPVWTLLGAYAVAGPYVQAVGRMRCLVQGCCHGRKTLPHVGIRYWHPRSRVCKLSDLAHVPIHPTPLYSILWNALTALVVARLWTLHAALHLVGGVYLLMNGLGRFVEEAYRGEPQTPVVARLRLYQWVAAGTVVAGALVTALASSEGAPSPEPNWACVVAGGLFGLVTWAAMGVDFPDSNRRFSRLA